MSEPKVQKPVSKSKLRELIDELNTNVKWCADKEAETAGTAIENIYRGRRYAYKSTADELSALADEMED